MRTTKRTIEALVIIHTKDVRTATDFAELFYPDSPAWDRSYNVGQNGAVRGRGIVKSAGSYLGKLEKARMLYYSVSAKRYFLTTKGLGTLSAHGI